MINSPMSRFLLALVICGWLNGAGAAAPTYHLQLTAAQENFDDSNDSFIAVTGSIRSILGLTRHSAVNLNADLYTRAYSDFDQSDHDGILVEAIYNFVPTGGFRKPTYLFGLRQEVEQYDQSARDADKTSLLLGVAIRTSDKVTVTPGAEIYRRSSDLTDRDVLGIFLNTDMRLSDKWLSYVNFKVQSEDTTANVATATSLRASRSDLAGAHLPGEPGYVPPPSNTSSNSTLDTDSDNIIITLGANYSIDRHQSFDISFEYANYSTSAEGDTNSDVLSFDYFYKF